MTFDMSPGQRIIPCLMGDTNLPMATVADAEWLQLGRDLRATSPDLYDDALRSMERMIALVAGGEIGTIGESCKTP